MLWYVYFSVIFLIYLTFNLFIVHFITNLNVTHVTLSKYIQCSKDKSVGTKMNTTLSIYSYITDYISFNDSEFEVNFSKLWTLLQIVST